jgi:hypothetical protein
MRKKTVTKRHFKQLPTNRDLDRVLRRDDALYDFEDRKKRETERPTIAGGTRAALDHFASATAPARVEAPAPDRIDPDNPPSDYGAGKDHQPERQDGRQDAAASKPAETTGKDAEPATARQDAGKPPPDPLPKPTTPAAYGPWLAAWLATLDDPAAIKARYKAEQDIRLSFRVPEPTKEESTAWIKLKDDRLAELAGGS